jgi:hypothetical protein
MRGGTRQGLLLDRRQYRLEQIGDIDDVGLAHGGP